jgi:hypothetical protein
MKDMQHEFILSILIIHVVVISGNKVSSVFSATTYRVAQRLERRVQRSDDPCVGGSNPTGALVPV